MDFLGFANFLGFMQALESSKDTWYKLPLMGVLPQASFRLTTVGRGSNPSNGSRPSTPPGAAAAFAPWHGISHRRDAAMPEMCLCLECRWSTPAAHLVAVWWHRTREMRLPALQGSALRWSWSWWTGGLEPAVATRRCWCCAKTNHPPHADVKVDTAEVVVLARFPFWSCFVPSC